MMATISIEITTSDIELVSGIPTYIELTTNVPATIFYTLDGSTPTVSSDVAIGNIELPTDINTVTLKAYATDGMDSSAIITQYYGPRILGARRAGVTVSSGGEMETTYGPGLFGSYAPRENPPTYGSAAGDIVDQYGVDGIPDGYDGSGTGTYTNETEKELDQYQLLFSESNRIGLRGRGLGTLPATVTVLIPPQRTTSVPVGSADPNKPTFNPKALVIYHDNDAEPFDPNTVPIYRSAFNLENHETSRSGNNFYTNAYDGHPVTGDCLKTQYNPRTNTMTYYYRDSATNRWIISKTQLTLKDPSVMNLSQMVFGRGSGGQRVYKWLPFRYRTLM